MTKRLATEKEISYLHPSCLLLEFYRIRYRYVVHVFQYPLESTGAVFAFARRLSRADRSSLYAVERKHTTRPIELEFSIGMLGENRLTCPLG